MHLRRATLTADERARQNRDRNREHARNTRLRKKAYVEELKRTWTELVAQRDASDLEKRHEKERDLEVLEVCYRVMEEFMGTSLRLTAPSLVILHRTRFSNCFIVKDNYHVNGALAHSPVRHRNIF